MRTRHTNANLLAVTLCGSIVALATPDAITAADAPSAKLALSFKPVQQDVELESPAANEVEQCQVKVERRGKASGWVVLGPAGQVLRRFMDTNGDNVVDQWRYYHHGLEVYRDIDANFNNKVDQSRWLNTAGTRWGLDTNEDGRIDQWKVLSAEEATREAFRALIAQDERAMQTLLLTSDDARTLGLDATLSKKLLEAGTGTAAKLRAVMTASKKLSPQSQWMRFDSSAPSIIPAEDGKAGGDLTIYANALAIIETKGDTLLVQMGEMVRVGDTWKLTQIPEPLEGTSVQVTVGGVLMQPALASATAATPAATVTPQMQKLLDDLQKLDKSSPDPSASRTVLAKYNSQRADLLAQLVKLSQTDEERSQWTRQMVDGIAAAVQTGSYADGLERLKSIEAEVGKSPKSPLLGYITYRRLLAEYSLQLQEANSEKRQDVLLWWLKELEAFVQAYPEADDTPEALLQLAITLEFSGKMPDAKKWYGKLVSDHADSAAGNRAAGAMRRLEIEGKPFEFTGSNLKGGTFDVRQLRGKVVLVAYWATWCKPCTEDLTLLRALYEEHRSRGFEIVGVNLDTTADGVDAFLKQYRVPWPQVHEPGGLESPPAKAFGIISLPTMFLVGADGKVVTRNPSIPDLKTQLPELLKAK